ncbi:MAG: efflux RND transporter periplasmic adaptor subunit [Parvularculaceae bacterium]|nr:efflux RND transporter periplasmic adaptor subunit [Parvularculaceae bacterium]
MKGSRVFAAGAAVGVFAGLLAAAFFSSSSDAPGAAAGPAGRAGAGGASRGAMLPAITTATVGAANVGRAIDAVGYGRAAKSVTLVSEATGLVETVAAKAGAAVAAGDVILKLDDAQQKIALARARAQYPIAKANSERYAALYAEDSASKLEADTAFNDFKSAEAELRAADYALKQRTIIAPFDGVVGLTSIEPGDYVRAGDVVTTIDNLSALIVEFSVPQEEAAGVKLGQKVEAVLAGAGGGRLEGAVSAIDSRVDVASRTLKIEATFANHAGALLPGATYAVSTTNEGSPATSVPGLAVQWDRTGAYVWKIAKDGAVQRTGVIILQRRDEIALVDGDLAPGEVVIVEGADRVRPGMAFPQTSGVSTGAGAARSAGAL